MRYLKYTLVSLLLALPFSVQAVTFSEQPINDTQIAINEVSEWTGTVVRFPFGTGLVSTTTIFSTLNFEINFNRIQAGDYTVGWQLSEFTDPSYASSTGNNILFLANSVSQGFNGNIVATTSTYTMEADKYYRINNAFGFSSGDDFGAQASTSDMFFSFTSGTTTIASTETKILAVEPSPDSLANATSTEFVISVIGGVLESDYNSEIEVYGRWRQETGVGIGDNSIFKIGGEYSMPIVASGNFDLSTTAEVTNTGWYFGYAEIRKPRLSLFGINIFWKTLDSLVWKFEVGTSTEAEKQIALLLMEGTGISSGTASTSDATSNLSCNFLSSFTFGDCMRLLFVPPTSEAINTFNNLRENFLSIFPIGYMTRFVEILSGTSSTTVMLPTITATLFSGTGDEELFVLSMDDVILGGIAQVETVVDPIYGKTFEGVFRIWIQTLMAIAVTVLIALDVMASSRRHDHLESVDNRPNSSQNKINF